ncbi:hypothetical protein C2E23DRAFT_568654 [Lenzites betulinus]|nr:hypothetical protein C2E23DRAFT_568654 [Lenzites betulinus]
MLARDDRALKSCAAVPRGSSGAPRRDGAICTPTSLPRTRPACAALFVPRAAFPKIRNPLPLRAGRDDPIVSPAANLEHCAGSRGASASKLPLRGLARLVLARGGGG